MTAPIGPGRGPIWLCVGSMMGFANCCLPCCSCLLPPGFRAKNVWSVGFSLFVFVFLLLLVILLSCCPGEVKLSVRNNETCPLGHTACAFHSAQRTALPLSGYAQQYFGTTRKDICIGCMPEIFQYVWLETWNPLYEGSSWAIMLSASWRFETRCDEAGVDLTVTDKSLVCEHVLNNPPF